MKKVYFIMMVLLGSILLSSFNYTIASNDVYQAAQAYNDNIMDPSLLPNGSVILFHNWVAYDSNIWADTRPILIDTFNILWSIPQERDIKIVMYQDRSNAKPKVHELLGTSEDNKTWNGPLAPPQWRQETYGETWVDLGYIPGLTEAGDASMAEDFRNIVEIDYYGTQLKDIPLMQNIAPLGGNPFAVDAYDFDLYIWGSYSCTKADSKVRVWWTQGSPPYHLPMLVMTISSCIPNILPYYGPTNPIRGFRASPQVSLFEGGVSNREANIGDDVTIWFKAKYAHDDSIFNETSGSIHLNNWTMTWSETNLRWEYNYTTTEPGLKTFNITDVIDDLYGTQTYLDQVGTLNTTYYIPSELVLQVDNTSPIIGEEITISGSLSLSNGTKVGGAVLTLSYSVDNGSSWHEVSNLITENDGSYITEWMPSDIGNYIIKVSWEGEEGIPILGIEVQKLISVNERTFNANYIIIVGVFIFSLIIFYIYRRISS